MPAVTKEEWDQFLSRHPNAHLLQTSSWGALKRSFGWDVIWVVVRDAGAQILVKSLPLGLKWAYIPKGPVGQIWIDLWPDEVSGRRAKGPRFCRCGLLPEAHHQGRRQPGDRRGGGEADGR